VGAASPTREIPLIHRSAPITDRGGNAGPRPAGPGGASLNAFPSSFTSGWSRVSRISDLDPKPTRVQGLNSRGGRARVLVLVQHALVRRLLIYEPQRAPRGVHEPGHGRLNHTHPPPPPPPPASLVLCGESLMKYAGQHESDYTACGCMHRPRGLRRLGVPRVLLEHEGDAGERRAGPGATEVQHRLPQLQRLERERC
jgi:hypothetical protein